jgi:hypothetical protein
LKISRTNNRGAGGVMKKIIGIILAVALLCGLAYWYLALGKKAAVESKVYMETSKTEIDDAKKSMEDLEKSQEESRKAIEQMGGGAGR